MELSLTHWRKRQAADLSACSCELERHYDMQTPKETILLYLRSDGGGRDGRPLDPPSDCMCRLVLITLIPRTQYGATQGKAQREAGISAA